MSYYTIEEHLPHVYHTYETCPAGKAIKSANRREGEGSGRRLCDDCEYITKKLAKEQQQG